MKNFFAIIKKGIGLFLGGLLLTVGGFMGIEDLQAPGDLSIPIMVFSLAAIIVGSLILWLTLKSKEQR